MGQIICYRLVPFQLILFSAISMLLDLRPLHIGDEDRNDIRMFWLHRSLAANI